MINSIATMGEGLCWEHQALGLCICGYGTFLLSLLMHWINFAFFFIL